MRIRARTKIDSPQLQATLVAICQQFELSTPSENLLLLANFESTLPYLWQTSSDILRQIESLVSDDWVEMLVGKLHTRITRSLSRTQHTSTLSQKLLVLTRGSLRMTVWYLIMREALKGVPTIYLQKSVFSSQSSPKAIGDSLIKSSVSDLVLVPSDLINLFGYYEKEVKQWCDSEEYLFVRLYLEEELINFINTEGLLLRFDLPKLFERASIDKNMTDLWYLLLDHCPSSQTRYSLVLTYLYGETDSQFLSFSANEVKLLAQEN